MSVSAAASASTQCTAVASGPTFSWNGGGTFLTVKVTCDAAVSQITINNGQWLVNYDNPTYTDLGASGFSKTCNNASVCTLSMNIGYPYSVPGKTSVTTWSANASWPAGSSNANGMYDPYP